MRSGRSDAACVDPACWSSATATGSSCHDLWFQESLSRSVEIKTQHTASLYEQPQETLQHRPDQSLHQKTDCLSMMRYNRRVAFLHQHTQSCHSLLTQSLTDDDTHQNTSVIPITAQQSYFRCNVGGGNREHQTWTWSLKMHSMEDYHVLEHQKSILVGEAFTYMNTV